MKAKIVNERDFTQRTKELEKENRKLDKIILKQEHALKNLEKILEIVPDVAIQYIDRDGTLFKWNRTSRRLYGYREEEVLGKRIQDVLLSGAAAQEFSDGIDKLWTTAKPTAGMGWHVKSRESGSVFVRSFAIPLIEHGTPIAICTIQVDATDHKRAEDVLVGIQRDFEKKIKTYQEAENRLRTFIDYNHSWEYWIGPDLKMVLITPSCELITGYRPDEFMTDDRLLSMIIHPDDLEKIDCINAPADESVHATEQIFRIMTRGGQLRRIAHVCQPVFGEDGQFLGRRASNRDITGQYWEKASLGDIRSRLEKQLAMRTRELQELSEKLEKKNIEMYQQKSILNKLNQELLETNKAVSVLAKSQEKKKVETEKKISATILSKILPIINNLRRDSNMSKSGSGLDVISAYLNELSSHMDSGARVMSALSVTEAQVATMIKNGCISNEIAARLNISILTVKTHRRNIRKKLGLRNSKENLSSFLKAHIGGGCEV